MDNIACTLWWQHRNSIGIWLWYKYIESGSLIHNIEHNDYLQYDDHIHLTILLFHHLDDSCKRFQHNIVCMKITEICIGNIALILRFYHWIDIGFLIWLTWMETKSKPHDIDPNSYFQYRIIFIPIYGWYYCLHIVITASNKYWDLVMVQIYGIRKSVSQYWT